MPAVFSRGWCITINNPPKDVTLEYYLSNLLEDDLIVYGVGQVEIGASGTEHWQIYIVTKANPNNKNGFSSTWVKQNITAKGHIEKRYGSHEQARDYCMKEETRKPDTDYVEVGDPLWHDEVMQKNGKHAGAVNRAKILQIKDKIDDGVEDRQLYADHFGEMLRYSKAFDRYRMTMTEKFRQWQTKAVWIWGPAHTGKSHRAREWALKIDEEPYYINTRGSDSIWFDGMKPGCKVVVWDDFRGQAPISFMLRMLDHTPLNVETKGSMMPFAAEWVIFTSNEHPRDVYGKQPDNKIPLEVLNAWSSRFEGHRGSIKKMETVYRHPEGVMPSAEEQFDLIEQTPLRPPIVDLVHSEDGLSPQSSPIGKRPRLAFERDDADDNKFRKLGPEKVQSKLSFKPRTVDNYNDAVDDDEDVDDKLQYDKCGACARGNCRCYDHDDSRRDTFDSPRTYDEPYPGAGGL